MTTFKNISAIIIIFGVFSTLYYATSADPNTHLVTKICNGVKYDFHADIRKNINYVLDDVSLGTSSHGYNYYSRVPSGGTIDVAYGHGACNGELSEIDCDACMTEAYFKIENGCPENTGAQVKLQDCRIRYEIYPFTEYPTNE